MRFARLAVVAVPMTAALGFAAAPAVRKDSNGVYGMIDSVVFEPVAGVPERIRIWGAFAIADVIGFKDGKVDYVRIGFFHPPKHGYMYYTVNRRDPATTQSEWAAMKAIAGTGQLAAWGAHIPAADSGMATRQLDTAFARIVATYNGRVRAPGEPAALPDTFPQRMRGVAANLRAGRMSASQLGFVPAPSGPPAEATPPPGD